MKHDGMDYIAPAGGWAPTREGREGDSQPMPVVNSSPDIQSAVIADIERRREVGISRYGTALQPHNGRNALLDAYEEVLDLACYLKQRLVEEESEVEAVERIRQKVMDELQVEEIDRDLWPEGPMTGAV